jgi:hypothetical protein
MFLARICELAVCNPGADGETSHTYCGGAVRATPQRKDGLEGRPILRLERKPHPTFARGAGRCTDLAFPNARADDETGGGA